jgi:hypothetical protein
MTLATSSSLPCLCCQRKALYRAKSVNRAPHERSPVGGRMWPAQGERRAGLRQGRTAPASRQGGSSQLRPKIAEYAPDDDDCGDASRYLQGHTRLIRAVRNGVSRVPWWKEHAFTIGIERRSCCSCGSGDAGHNTVSSNAFTLSSPSLERPIASLASSKSGGDARAGAGIALGAGIVGLGLAPPGLRLLLGARCAIAGVALHLVRRAEFETRAP